MLLPTGEFGIVFDIRQLFCGTGGMEICFLDVFISFICFWLSEPPLNFDDDTLSILLSGLAETTLCVSDPLGF